MSAPRPGAIVRMKLNHEQTGTVATVSPTGSFAAVEWDSGIRTVVLTEQIETVKATRKEQP